MPSSFCFVSVFFSRSADTRAFPSSPTRRSSDLGTSHVAATPIRHRIVHPVTRDGIALHSPLVVRSGAGWERSEEHTSELQSLRHLVCRLLLEKKKLVRWL